MSDFAEFVDSSVMFVLGVGGKTALLDEENARMLRDDLNKFLGESAAVGAEKTSRWYIGQEFLRNAVGGVL